MKNKRLFLSIILLIPCLMITSVYLYICKFSPSGWKEGKVGMSVETLTKIVPYFYREPEAKGGSYAMQTLSNDYAIWHIYFYFDNSGNSIEKIERHCFSRHFHWIGIREQK